MADSLHRSLVGLAGFHTHQEHEAHEADFESSSGSSGLGARRGPARWPWRRLPQLSARRIAIGSWQVRLAVNHDCFKPGAACPRLLWARYTLPAAVAQTKDSAAAATVNLPPPPTNQGARRIQSPVNTSREKSLSYR